MNEGFKEINLKLKVCDEMFEPLTLFLCSNRIKLSELFELFLIGIASQYEKDGAIVDLSDFKLLSSRLSFLKDDNGLLRYLVGYDCDIAFFIDLVNVRNKIFQFLSSCHVRSGYFSSSVSSVDNALRFILRQWPGCDDFLAGTYLDIFPVEFYYKAFCNGHDTFNFYNIEEVWFDE